MRAISLAVLGLAALVLVADARESFQATDHAYLCRIFTFCIVRSFAADDFYVSRFQLVARAISCLAMRSNEV